MALPLLMKMARSSITEDMVQVCQEADIIESDENTQTEK